MLPLQCHAVTHLSHATGLFVSLARLAAKSPAALPAIAHLVCAMLEATHVETNTRRGGGLTLLCRLLHALWHELVATDESSVHRSVHLATSPSRRRGNRSRACVVVACGCVWRCVCLCRVCGCVYVAVAVSWPLMGAHGYLCCQQVEKLPCTDYTGRWCKLPRGHLLCLCHGATLRSLHFPGIPHVSHV